jgi:hypothetical protein
MNNKCLGRPTYCLDVDHFHLQGKGCIQFTQKNKLQKSSAKHVIFRVYSYHLECSKLVYSDVDIHIFQGGTRTRA